MQTAHFFLRRFGFRMASSAASFGTLTSLRASVSNAPNPRGFGISLAIVVLLTAALGLLNQNFASQPLIVAIRHPAIEVPFPVQPVKAFVSRPASHTQAFVSRPKSQGCEPFIDRQDIFHELLQSHESSIANGGELSVSESFPENARQGPQEPPSVVQVAGVEPPCLFVRVPEQMERGDRDVCAFECPLEGHSHFRLMSLDAIQRRYKSFME